MAIATEVPSDKWVAMEKTFLTIIPFGLKSGKTNLESHNDKKVTCSNLPSWFSISPSSSSSVKCSIQAKCVTSFSPPFVIANLAFLNP